MTPDPDAEWLRELAVSADKHSAVPIGFLSSDKLRAIAARLDKSAEVVEGLAEVLEAYLSKSTYDPELKSFGFPLDCDTYDNLLNMKIALAAAAPYRKNNPQE